MIHADKEMFFSSADVSVLIAKPGSTNILWSNVLSVAWRLDHPAVPHYSYGSSRFTDVSSGAKIITGLLIAARSSRNVDPLLDLMQRTNVNPVTEVTQRVEKFKRFYGQRHQWLTVIPEMGEPEFEDREQFDELSIGPYQLTVRINPRMMHVVRESKTRPATIDYLDYDDAEFGMYIMSGVYFIQNSSEMDNKTSDPLTVQYEFIARGIDRRITQ